MHIEPIYPEFERVLVVRSGGFAGMIEQLEIAADLQANVTSSFDGERTFALSVDDATRLLTAIKGIVDDQPEPSAVQGADMYEYDIKVDWAGKIVTVRSVDVGATGVLADLISLTAEFLQREDAPFHIL